MHFSNESYNCFLNIESQFDGGDNDDLEDLDFRFSDEEEDEYEEDRKERWNKKACQKCSFLLFRAL